MAKKKRLGDLLVETGLLGEDQLLEALREQRKTKKKLGRILLDKNFVTERDLFHVLEMQFGIPYFDLNNNFIDPKIPKLISQKLAEMHNLIPVKFQSDQIFIAMSDPLDVVAIDDVKMATGLKVRVLMASEPDIKRLINRYYDSTEKAREAAQEFAEKNLVQEDDVFEENEDVINSPIVRLVNTVILQAARRKASDIHIEPFENFVRIRMRVDGVLTEMMTPEKSMHSGIVTRIKIMANLNISERRVPQDGRVETVVDGFPIAQPCTRY